MNKVGKRLLTFFIGLPLVFVLVYVTYLNHLPLQIALGLFCVVGANEFYDMLSKKMSLFSKDIILICVTLLPLSTYIFILSDISLDIAPWFFISELILLMGYECVVSKSFEKSVFKIAGSSLIILYTGYFITFLSKMTILENSNYIIILFLLNVFMCDSCAWFFGVLFGKNNRGYIAASPNKSLIGFAGGIVGAIFFSCVYKFIFPEIFNCSFVNLIVLSFITAIASIIGDLIESVFKRSCEVKDSGNLIPGRGGVLDSIDSILIAAPIFYIGQHFLF